MPVDRVRRGAGTLRPPVNRRSRPAVLFASLLAAGVFATGCGSLRDEVAATVGGEDITVDLVAGVAASPLAQGGLGQAEEPGRLRGDPQRAALAILVQDRLFAFELRRLGGEVSDEDRQAAAEQLAQLEQQGPLEPEVAELVQRLVENQLAVLRLSVDAETSVTDADVEAYFEANRDDFGTLICLDGLVAPPTAVTELRDQIEDGASFEEAIATRDDGVFPIEQTGPSTCVRPGVISDPGLAEVVESGPLDELQEFETAGQTGEAVVLLIRVTSRGPANGTEPSVVAEIRQTLEQEAQAARQERIGEVFDALVQRADVSVDPRYGRFDATSPTLILAPPVPRSSVSALAGSGLDPDAGFGG